jgi:hypothetical protein
MKKLIGLLVGMAALAPTQAHADGWFPFCFPPYRIEAGVNAYFRVVPLDPPNLAPWYTYWPYEAHFQTPTPPGPFPYWPGPQYAPSGPSMPMPTPSATSGMVSPPMGFQAAGYSQAPRYWYTR